MIKIGISGQNGFIGWHLAQTVMLDPENFTLIPFERELFESDPKLDAFVASCDAIIHLAGMNRHPDPQVIYDTNIELSEKLVASLERTNSQAHVLFSSSSQEQSDNLYGRSKRLAREKLTNWAKTNTQRFTGLIIPNVFGPFSKPFYNSVVATFCHQITHRGTPKIEKDCQINLIYVGDLVSRMIDEVIKGKSEKTFVKTSEIPHQMEIKVSGILEKLNYFHTSYVDKHEVPALHSVFDLQLFNTFLTYIKMESFFPRPFKLNMDERGTFVELARMSVSGQTSFSTTVPGITRGNHFHTRKIERFAVIKGKATIQFRKIGTDKVYSFDLDGDKPAYVDMPIWYTHNITNTGDELLYTVFWINEPYNSDDQDTYFESV